MNLRPAAFLDRDGVINHDIGYLYKPEDFIWIDGAIEAIRYFNDHGFLVFVITNQSGVARGYYTEEDVKKLHGWINSELKNHKAHIDSFYYCPHYPQGVDERYSLVCDCRKPQSGLIKQASKEWLIDFERSFMVGDKLSDMECAVQAGIKGFRFTGGNLYSFLQQTGCII